MKKSIDKTEEDLAANKTYSSDKLEDSLTVVNMKEKVTVDKFGNHSTVEEYSSNFDVDKNQNEEEKVKVKVWTSTKENQVKKIVRQFETGNKVNESPCTPTRKEKKGGNDSLKKQGATKVPFTPAKITKQEGGKHSNSKSKRKASISKQWDTLAFPRGNRIKLQIEMIEKSTRGGISMTKMRQELVTNFFKKSSSSDNNSYRGSLRIQSLGTEDGPERAVEGSIMRQNTIRPIRATDDIRTTPKNGSGQSGRQEQRLCVQLDDRKGSGDKIVNSRRTPPGQKLYLGGET